MTIGRDAFSVTKATAVHFAADDGSEQAARFFIDLVQRTRRLSLSVADGGDASRGITFRLLADESASGVEGYSLVASPQRIVVSASDSRGLFYGAVTLWQLMTSAAPRQAEMKVPALTIDDAPRFRWRGLMLDSARHYQSPEFIRKFIDVMALHKLNVLHWHLTDDQAWRLEIRKYPKLTSIGAWRVPAGPAAAADIDPTTGKPRLYGGFYTQEQVRDIVAYAAARHIQIVPEIEMPGHASAAIAAYPHLGVSDGSRLTTHDSLPPADWGVYPNLFNIENSTFAFLEDVLGEVIDLFPGEYIHVGGDEAVKDQWRASAAVQQRMRALGIKDEQALQSWFIQRIGKYLSEHDRRLIGWDEILEGGLAPDATVMSWRGVEGAVAAATAGHDAVLSPGPTLYFDNRPYDAPIPGRARVVSVEDVYRFDPAPAALSEAQRGHILGLQANVWTEHIRSEARVEYMTFPKLAALAEIAWSPAEGLEWSSFQERLPAQLARYQQLGVGYAHVPVPAPAAARRSSHELKLCSENIALSLEDDAPVRGERAVFLVDIMNPCWIYQAADLSRPRAIAVAVGQAPFNFQVGADVNKIPLAPQHSAAGELQVRLDACDGEVIAALPLAPAVNNVAVTELPEVEIDAREGKHDLCFTFTRSAVDPIWAINSVELVETVGRLSGRRRTEVRPTTKASD